MIFDQNRGSERSWTNIDPVGVTILLPSEDFVLLNHSTFKPFECYSDRLLAQRPRYHIHYTPTYSSWLNQVERWFGLITQRAIRRGSFSSVKDLIEKIDSFVQHYNRSHRPFVWTATADSILQKISRLCSVISGTRY
jgi:hypothetical protein